MFVIGSLQHFGLQQLIAYKSMYLLRCNQFDDVLHDELAILRFAIALQLSVEFRVNKKPCASPLGKLSPQAARNIGLRHLATGWDRWRGPAWRSSTRARAARPQNREGENVPDPTETRQAG